MLLAIDTSTGTSVSVVDHDMSSGELRCLAETGTDDTMRHAEVIGGFIRDALAEAGEGPRTHAGRDAGQSCRPHTGLGIGRPFVPVVSHDAVAWAWYADGGEGALQVVTDARRREVAVSDYDGLDADRLPVRRIGPGLAPHDEVPPARGIRIDAQLVPARAVGMLAELGFAAGRLPLTDDAPIYLRAPDVTLAERKRVLQ